MTTLKNTIITDTGYLQLPAGPTQQRPGYNVATFSTVGSTTWTCPAGVTSVEVLVVAGGGGGANDCGGGGGAGGLIYNANYTVAPTTVYTVVVGNYGAAGTSTFSTSGTAPGSGGNSQFDTLVAVGGGAGGSRRDGTYVGNQATVGGSGGGAAYGSSNYNYSANGTPFQGNPGGYGYASGTNGGSGGGGAGGAGGSSLGGATGTAGYGGPGLTYSITGSAVVYAQGGPGGPQGASLAQPNAYGSGGRGSGNSVLGQAGTGVQGIVIVRYYQNAATGMTRYNTDFGYTEIYNASTNLWTPVVAQRPMLNEAASGGVIGHQGIYKSHYFTTVGTDTFTPMYSGYVEVLVVAAGGGGGSYAAGGGGGGGGVIYNPAYWVNAGVAYTVGVGDGGMGGPVSTVSALNGSNSFFDTLVAYGGGRGGAGWIAPGSTPIDHTAGGSGGGAGGWDGTQGTVPRSGGAGYPGQGMPGGKGQGISGNTGAGGGGGGAVMNIMGTPQTISATGTIGSITGSGPWTATITGMVSTANLRIGDTILATAGTGTLYGGTPTSVVVSTIPSGVSITYTVTGGSTPTAGTITSIVVITQPNDSATTVGGPGGTGSPYAMSGVSLTLSSNNDAWLYYGTGGSGAGYNAATSGTTPGAGGFQVMMGIRQAGGPGGVPTDKYFLDGGTSTGGGGGGNASATTGLDFGGKGGSGTVIVRYVAQRPAVNLQFLKSGYWTAPTGVTKIELLVVGGGGSGGWDQGGGGGAGGLVYSSAYPVSPGTTYTITIGPGGAGVSSAVHGNNGTDSSFDVVVAKGGGGGGSLNGTRTGNVGGSGGGASGSDSATSSSAGGAQYAGQGNAGGSGYTYAGGGGGGAGGPGGSVTVARQGGNGGPGLPYAISGQLTFYAGGGGGASATTSTPYWGGGGGVGGGGNGAKDSTSNQQGGFNGTGAGGGGAHTVGTTGAGGSGVVIIKYYP